MFLHRVCEREESSAVPKQGAPRANESGCEKDHHVGSEPDDFEIFVHLILQGGWRVFWGRPLAFPMEAANIEQGLGNESTTLQTHAPNMAIHNMRAATRVEEHGGQKLVNLVRGVRNFEGLEAAAWTPSICTASISTSFSCSEGPWMSRVPNLAAAAGRNVSTAYVRGMSAATVIFHVFIRYGSDPPLFVAIFCSTGTYSLSALKVVVPSLTNRKKENTLI